MSTQLNRSGERGNVMLFALLVVILLAGFGLTVVNHVTSSTEEGVASAAHQQRLFLAESALDFALQDMRTGGTGTVGSADAPLSLGGGEFYTVGTDRGNGTTTVFAVGRYAGGARTIRARVRQSRAVFHHAIFAGNSSGDPDYVMKFGGQNNSADDINGDVYSGGSILVEGDAEVSGTARAKDTVTGMTGHTGGVEAGFDFTAVDFEKEGVIDVAAEFARHARWRNGDGGGTAGELPESHAAHIFRLNPSDRTDATRTTEKDDYFLEDPYEPLGIDRADNGKNPYMVTIDNDTGATRHTYFIDGNLWIHNKKSYSFMLGSAKDTGVQVSFIVKGNITFSDSFRMQDTDLDAVGFVALKDPDVPDSGNIYLGDPAYGTLSELHGYLYAENDFLDINLDKDGSKSVRLLGTMSAGNQVAIERTYKNKHSKLTVDWDQRLKNGATSLPFLSTDLPATSGQVVLEGWVESPIVPVGRLGPDDTPPPPPLPDEGDSPGGDSPPPPAADDTSEERWDQWRRRHERDDQSRRRGRR